MAPFPYRDPSLAPGHTGSLTLTSWKAGSWPLTEIPSCYCIVLKFIVFLFTVCCVYSLSCLLFFMFTICRVRVELCEVSFDEVTGGRSGSHRSRVVQDAASQPNSMTTMCHGGGFYTKSGIISNTRGSVKLAWDRTGQIQ